MESCVAMGIKRCVMNQSVTHEHWEGTSSATAWLRNLLEGRLFITSYPLAGVLFLLFNWES